MGRNRMICSVLHEIRECDKTKNYSYLIGLLEEAQVLANRMESALWDQKEFLHMEERYNKLKKEVKELEKKTPNEQE